VGRVDAGGTTIVCLEVLVLAEEVVVEGRVGLVPQPVWNKRKKIRGRKIDFFIQIE
jgi:hypothetical protein